MGTKVDLSERDLRFKRVRDAMKKKGMDALLCFGHGSKPRYIQYLTNYRTGSHEMMLFLPLDGEPVGAVSSPSLPWRVRASGWVNDVLGGYNLYDSDFVPKMIRAMAARGFTEGTLGIGGYEWVMPAGAYLQLKGTFPTTRLVNADEMLDRIMNVKTPLELRQIREEHRYVRIAMERFMEVLKPGKTQVEVVGQALQAAREAGAVSANAQTGEGGAMGTPRNVPYKCNDIVKLYPSAQGEGGHGNEQMLNLIFRKPTEQEEKLLESELKGYAEQRKVAKPGVRLSDLAKVFDRVMIADGWKWEKWRSGYDYHGIGERPAWAETMKDNPAFWYVNQDWKLEANMVINYHARRNYAALGGQVTELGGTGINDDILITPNGAERLLGEDWDLRWRRM